jgi:hypothetical protein
MELGYNEIFECFSFEAADAQALSIAAETYNGTQITGGSSIVLNKNGNIALRLGSLTINAVYTGYTGIKVIAGVNVQFENGICVGVS